jgi:type VI secretion system protein ImpK
VRNFDRAARDAGVPDEQIAWSRYALCASIDDVVLNTPWGAESGWSQNSLINTFDRQVASGTGFFDLLRRLIDNPGIHLPVIELLYTCLALGFMGLHRHTPRGPAELEKLREDTYAVITRQRPPAEAGLSPHWQGVAAPYRPKRATLPVWVVGSAALAVIAGLFVWFSSSLNASSDDLFERMMRAPPAQMPQLARSAPVAPPPPPPPPPSRGHSTNCASSSSRRSTRSWSPCSAPTRRRSCASTTPACSPRAAPPCSRSSCRCCIASARR